MLRENKRFLLASLVGLVLFLTFENLFVSSFQECVGPDTTENGTNYTDQNSRIISAFVTRQVPCTVDLFDDHAGLLAAIAGFIVAWFTYTLWAAAIEQGKTSQESINLARKAMITAERPWIQISTQVLSPLTWENGGCHLVVLFSLTNIGKTPAKAVRAWPKLSTIVKSSSQEQRTALAKPSKNKGDIGVTIFPRETKFSKWRVDINPIEITAYIDQIQKLNPKMTDAVDFISPILIGDVSYRSVFEDTVQHHTGFILELTVSKPGTLESTTTEIGENIPAEYISLRPNILFEPYID
jgi:hypothetical protein